MPTRRPQVLDVQWRRSNFARARPGDGWRPHARAQGHMTQHGLASARETVLVVWAHTDHSHAPDDDDDDARDFFQDTGARK